MHRQRVKHDALRQYLDRFVIAYLDNIPVSLKYVTVPGKYRHLEDLSSKTDQAGCEAECSRDSGIMAGPSMWEGGRGGKCMLLTCSSV